MAIRGQKTLPGMSGLEPRAAASGPRQDREFQEQSALFWFLVEWERRHPILHWVFAIPNGLALTPRTARKAKLQGVRAGVWDIFVPLRRGECPGLWIEMKIPPNKLTSAQRDFQTALQTEGFLFAICMSWTDAAELIVKYVGIDDSEVQRAIAVNTRGGHYA